MTRNRWFLICLTTLLCVGLAAGCNFSLARKVLPTAALTSNATDTPAPYPYPISTQFFPPALTLDHTPTPSFTVSPTSGPTLTPTRTEVPDPAACVPENTQVDYGLVQWVFDGDSIEVDIQGAWFTISYLGVDAPDVAFNFEPFGPQAKARNEFLVMNQVVRLVRDTPEKDRFGRLLRYVLVGDTFINYELIAEGLAHPSEAFSDIDCLLVFRQAEQAAEVAQVGMWAPTIAGGPTELALASGAVSQTPQNLLASPSLTLGPSPTGSLTTSQTPGTSQTSSLTTTGTTTQSGNLTRTPTLTLETSQTAQNTVNPEGVPDIVISGIFYMGNATGESDEFVLITNQDTVSVNLENWWLEAGDTEAVFLFPSYTLSPGFSCPVYTNEDHPEICGFSFESPQPLWDNHHACGRLYNPDGVLASQNCY